MLNITRRLLFWTTLALCAPSAGLFAQAPPAPDASVAREPDLADFRTLEKAISTHVAKPSPAPVSLPGYLGINVKSDGKSALTITQIQTESPAARAGLKVGDVLTRVADQPVSSADGLRALLQAKPPGTVLSVVVVRQEKPLDVKVTLEATSRPLALKGATKNGVRRALMGVQISAPGEGPGVQVDQVQPDMPAASAGIKVGDVVVKIDGNALKDSEQFREILAMKKPGDVLALAVLRDKKERILKVKLVGDDRGGSEPLTFWRKDTYRLAVVVVDFADVKVSEKIEPKHWHEAIFSRKTFKKSATGQNAFGSLNDFFQEQSFGQFKIDGKVFDPVHAEKKRGEYYQGAGGGAAAKTVLLVEALKKLAEKAGTDALNGFDGLCFVYAGAAVPTNRGSLYYPHRGVVLFQGKRWPYIMVPEGGKSMASISVFAPEFAQLLGLPDLAARPDVPGSTGLGVWCLMSNGAGKKGRPGHLSAWCKEQLGWLDPVVIDPATKQKLILSPVQTSRKECIKILARADGSEYFLLENRSAQGFDTDLPGQGLLIWRVVNGRPSLEEAHGVAGPTGPRVFLDAVPYPSKANDAFTPYTTPSSAALLGGGQPVFITNIRRLADGRITLFVGYEYY